MRDILSGKRLALRLVAAAAIVVVGFLAELGLYWAESARLADAYSRADFAAADFESWEFRPEAGGYYALANNSYFIIEGLGGRSAKSIDVYMDIDSSDTTEKLIYYVGQSGGVQGEFMAALKQVEPGVWRAEGDFSALESLKVYPTELVRTTVGFSGIALNPVTPAAGFSVALALAMALTLGAAAYTVHFVRRVRRGDKRAFWLGGWLLWASGTLGLAGRLAAGMFTSVRGSGELLGFGGMAAALATVAFIALVKRIKSPHNRLFALVLAAGLLMCGVNAPLQSPDEHNHFVRSLDLSRGRLAYNYEPELNADERLLLDLFPAELANEKNLRGQPGALERLGDYLAGVRGSYAAESEHRSSAQLLLPYVPAALAIALARLLGGGALMGLYAARFANLLMFSLCARAALKLARRYRGSLMLCALLPISLYMAASVSYDAMFLSALLLYLGMLFSDRVSGWRFAGLAALLAVMAMIKPLYLPLALLVLLVPEQRLCIKRRPLAVLALAAAGIGGWLAALKLAGLLAVGIPSAGVLAGVDYAGQILYVLRNPLRYLVVVLVDGYSNLFYLGSFGLFGSLDLAAGLTGLLTPALVLAVAFISPLRAPQERRGETPALLGLAGFMYLLIVTAFYVSWSTLGSTSILGVQARYFIPSVFMISAGLSRLCGRLAAPVPAPADAERITLTLCSLAAFLAAAEIFTGYFLM